MSKEYECPFDGKLYRQAPEESVDSCDGCGLNYYPDGHDWRACYFIKDLTLCTDIIFKEVKND